MGKKRVLEGDEKTQVLFQMLLQQGMPLKDVQQFLKIDNDKTLRFLEVYCTPPKQKLTEALRLYNNLAISVAKHTTEHFQNVTTPEAKISFRDSEEYNLDYFLRSLPIETFYSSFNLNGHKALFQMDLELNKVFGLDKVNFVVSSFKKFNKELCNPKEDADVGLKVYEDLHVIEGMKVDQEGYRISFETTLNGISGLMSFFIPKAEEK